MPTARPTLTSLRIAADPDRWRAAGVPLDAGGHATVGGVRVACAYFPNGGAVGGPRWPYKLAWMARVRRWTEAQLRAHERFVLVGDFNVAPTDLDVAFPDVWRDGVLTHPEARAALERIGALGLVDVLRKHHPADKVYSWWDYQMLGFVKGNGLRIDHVWVSPPLASRSIRTWIDKEPRGWERPSDHAPVVAEFS